MRRYNPRKEKQTKRESGAENEGKKTQVILYQDGTSFARDIANVHVEHYRR
jgi:hypothetical protein